MAKAKKRKTKAIVKIAPQPERPWLLTQDEITIVKNSIAKGATDEELKFCLTVARRYRLDPFKQQIWFIKRWDSNADNGQGGTGARVWVAQVGIYGMAHIAGRDHRDYGSISLPEYGPMIELEIEGNKVRGPEWARVKIFKKGIAEPSIGEAFFEEYCPKQYKNTLFWRTMPHRMIAKCAKAQGIREAYPDLGGLYIPEEMHRMDESYTDGGRQIIEGEVVGTKEAAQAVAARKIAEHQAKQEKRQYREFLQVDDGKPRTNTFYGSKSENETKPKNAIRGDSRPSVPKVEETAKVEREVVTLTPYRGKLALSGAGLSIVRAEMTEDDKAFFGFKLYDKTVYCMEERLLFNFQDVCKRIGIEVKLMEAAKPIKAEPRNATLPRAVIPPAPVFPDQPPPAKSTDPILAEAKVIEKEGKKPFMTLTWSGGKHSCFDRGVWPILLAAVGKPVMLEVKAKGNYSNFVRIMRIDGMQFADEKEASEEQAQLY
jgi:phage recombination protein Bet